MKIHNWLSNNKLWKLKRDDNGYPTITLVNWIRENTGSHVYGSPYVLQPSHLFNNYLLDWFNNYLLEPMPFFKIQNIMNTRKYESIPTYRPWCIYFGFEEYRLPVEYVAALSLNAEVQTHSTQSTLGLECPTMWRHDWQTHIVFVFGWISPAPISGKFGSDSNITSQTSYIQVLVVLSITC